jgi:hypothetical protein
MLAAVSTGRAGSSRRALPAVLLAAGLAAGGSACNLDLQAAFTQLQDARGLAADLRVELHRSAEAAQRAVMAETDEASAEAAQESEQATQALERTLAELGPILTGLHFADEERLLQDFARDFAESREVDRTLLALAVENSNVKAQRLAFGPALGAADAFRDRMADAVRPARGAEATRVELLAARAELGVREIEALEAPHIAEAEDAAMTRLEERMAACEAAARAALSELASLLGPTAREALGSARTELDRFAQLQQQIVALSRQNTNVRSLAVALGNKRRLTAACDASLAALQEALAKRGYRATR